MAQFIPPKQEDVEYLEEDYYSLLNLGRNATTEDITYAYRKLSRLFHPDKHTDPLKKKNAEILFNKTKTAYEVLSDPHQRAIYDTLGVKGVETDGWQIVQRTKTPQEIRDEYEQLVKEREERRLQQRTNPRGTLIVGVNATEIFDSYDEDISFPSIEISSMTITQSVEAPLNTSDTFTLNGNLSSRNGIGSGSIGCSMRKVISAKGWTEFGVGAGNGLVFTLKGFRYFSSKCFGSLQGSFHCTPMGITPGLQAVIGRQLTKRTAGYLTWKGGNASSIKTTIAFDSSKGQLTTDIQFGLQGYFISLNYRHKLSDDGRARGSIKLGTFGAILEYGCEKKISQNSVVGATMAIGVPSGVTLKLKVGRANQNYVFPILLSEEILPSAVFYGTVAPILGWYVLKVLIIKPYQQRQKKKEAEKVQEANASKLAERRKEALMAVALMQETYNRIKEQEESKNGLIIIRALYGSPEQISDLGGESLESSQKVFDVTVQLQCLVKDCRLTLPERSKSNLPGFCDPCLGEDKCLLVHYSYKTIVHSITIKDNEILRIPNEH